MDTPTTIPAYNKSMIGEDKAICETLMNAFNENLPKAESKVWHRHPVWFLEGNPIVGYSKRKGGICMMFWSGQSFDEEQLEVEGSFKAAQIFYNSVDEINMKDVKRWLKKSQEIQWDYKNIVKNKGVLNRLK